ncbi:hypothetical protein [Luteimonas aquatica]|uniref:hypothetical protein n=1 Tax=Luteimonas aquatica TaxID=450364 RepID=UPI001F5846EB|nr:hypothetical protein [Luteimonas aquatica]
MTATLALAAACTPEPPPKAPEAAQAPSAPAPAPPSVPEPDPSTATYERAAPPTLQPVVLGDFQPGDPVGEASTGAVKIEDGKITGANGASFVTERVALVSGDDQFAPNQRYADAMMIEPRQQVELRHIVQQTAPGKMPGNAFCGSTADASYLALAKVMDGEDEVVKLIALSGTTLPAAAAQDVKLCASTHYFSKKK